MTLHYLSAHRQTPAEPLHQLGHHLRRLHPHQTLVSARVLLRSNVEVHVISCFLCLFCSWTESQQEPGGGTTAPEIVTRLPAAPTAR